MVDYHKLPLLLTSEVSKMFQDLRTKVSDNSSTIWIEKDIDLNFWVRGTGGNKHFYFKIEDVNLDERNGNKITFTTEYAPKDQTSIDKLRRVFPKESLSNVFSHWLANLQRYNSIIIHPSDSIEKQYESEFDDWFEIVDDDADKNAFDAKQQLLIEKVINKSILLLVEGGISEDDPIIVKSNWLKDNIASLTKSQVVHEVKKIYAQIRKKGLVVVKKVYDVWVNELIAMSYRIPVEGLGKFLVENL